MALMLTAVAERRREIGLHRSLGASRGDILLGFLLEAVTISAGGGAAGALLALAGTTLVARFEHLPLAFPGATLAIAALVSVTTGLAFGLYPAWRASMTDPITALRS